MNTSEHEKIIEKKIAARDKAEPALKDAVNNKAKTTAALAAAKAALDIAPARQAVAAAAALTEAEADDRDADRDVTNREADLRRAEDALADAYAAKGEEQRSAGRAELARILGRMIAREAENASDLDKANALYESSGLAAAAFKPPRWSTPTPPERWASFEELVAKIRRELLGQRSPAAPGSAEHLRSLLAASDARRA